MEYTKIGNTDIEVSRLCIGCMSFGKAGTMRRSNFQIDFTQENAVRAEISTIYESRL